MKRMYQWPCLLRRLIGIIGGVALMNASGYAFHWQDLWKTRDQQAQQLMQQGEFKKAAEQFERTDWRATAAFRAGEYQKAASAFQAQHADYNQGNALAYLGAYEQAIAAYDRALKKHPDNKDAAFNRQLVKKLLKQQQKQSSDSKKNSSKSSQSKPSDMQSSSSSVQSEEQPSAPKPSSPSKSQQTKKQQQKKSPQAAENQASDEQKQWLRLVPDDPGGLLREKFMRDYLHRQQE